MKCGITTTLETVSIHRPDRIDFRLVRGPVPHLVESAATRRRFARATDVSSCDLRGELSRRDEHEGTDAGVALAETIAIASANVLPDPVGERTRTSRPASASGRTGD